MAPWTPPGVDSARHHALVDGVPDWMRRPLRSWFEEQFIYRSHPSAPRKWIERIEAYDLAARTSWAEYLDINGPARLFEGLGDGALLVIDWLVFDN